MTYRGANYHFGTPDDRFEADCEKADLERDVMNEPMKTLSEKAAERIWNECDAHEVRAMEAIISETVEKPLMLRLDEWKNDALKSMKENAELRKALAILFDVAYNWIDNRDMEEEPKIREALTTAQQLLKGETK